MYQVFISYKSTDINKNRTWDSEMGEMLYEALEARGIKTFFAEKTLKATGESKYQQMIYEALDEVNFFVAMCSEPEYLKSSWIAHEIECFHGDILGGVKDIDVSAMYTFCEKSVDVHSIPLPMRSMQAYYSIEDVIAAIEERIKNKIKIQKNFEQTVLFAQQGAEASHILGDETDAFGLGKRIEGYEVVRCIGEGGTAKIYDLRDTLDSSRHLAAKVYKKDLLENESTREALLEETHILENLNNRHFPRVHRLVEDEKETFVIMDMVKGKCLREYLSDGQPVEVDTVIDWANQILDMMVCLHEQTPVIIYRDFKPHNLVLQDDGNLILVDFGSARYYNEDGKEDSVYLGTRGYAAPEQFGGLGQTDKRTDYYGFGKTLFSLLTAMKPTDIPDGENIYSLLKEVSEPLACIIEKCTFANPEDRYQNIEDIRYDLSHLSEVKRYYSKKAELLALPEIVQVQDNQGNISFVSENTAILFLADNQLADSTVSSVAGEHTEQLSPLPVKKQVQTVQKPISIPVIPSTPVPISTRTIPTPIPGPNSGSFPFPAPVPVTEQAQREMVAYVCTSNGLKNQSECFVHVYVLGKSMETDMFKYLIEHKDFDNISAVPFEGLALQSKVTISIASKNMVFDRNEAEFYSGVELFHYACFKGCKTNESGKTRVKVAFSAEGKDILRMKVRV